MKTKLKYVLSTITTVTILSGPAMAGQTAFDGPYAGVNFGYESIKAKTDTTGTGGLVGYSVKDEFGADGVTGGLFGGYGQTFGNIYLGGELEGSLNSTDYNYSDNSDETIKSKQNENYAASVRLGFLPVTNTLLYSRLGVIEGRFSTNAHLVDGATTVDANRSKYLTGAQFGLGAETALQGNVHLRLDWTYDVYKDWKVSANIPGDGIAETISPTANTFRVGLAYGF